MIIRNKKGQFVKGNSSQRTHGMAGSRIYNIWGHMKRRCTNRKHPKFKNYGKRGITIEWKTFEEFYKDMYKSYQSHIKEFGIKDTSIDRINNNGNYCKENCRWATQKEQQSNKRNNVLYKFNGEKLNLSQWARKIGVNDVTLWSRIKRNKWSIKKTLTTPIK